MSQRPTAFVTGATGLLGNNLVRLLLAQGFHVKALARSSDKAQQQFGVQTHERLEIVLGDIREPAKFETTLRSVDILFHTAAYFRESYEGGRHSKGLHDTNVLGTRALLKAAYEQGVRRILHVSSIAVLGHNPGGEVDEQCLQRLDGAEDAYYRSKIETDHVVYQFLEQHPDMHISLVLPGWMYGPGDLGPTSAGRFVLDFMRRALPAVPDATASAVDARDVALVALQAALHGSRGGRYLAAGRYFTLRELADLTASVTGVPAPRWIAPRWFVLMLALCNELRARLTGRPALLSLATAMNIGSDHGRRFSDAKIKREFGITFRPMEETLRDVIDFYRDRGMLPG
ncbi:MAG: NAD-dependent epimerase/dehydratase family protein [Rubrivivax sp.]|nr:MAG: NAD-dependent epimerase/dehydratase family protein [Rubrivivax sp.]